jgi:hypothetical protein
MGLSANNKQLERIVRGGSDDMKKQKEFKFAHEREPTFTRSEWNEIQGFRMSRIFETGETIPSLDELITSMKEVVAVDGENEEPLMRSFTVEPHESVLVVEDDNWERIPFFRSRLPRALIIRNPMIAVLALQTQDFDTVFLDYDLPCPAGLNGQHVASHLSEMKFTGKVVIHSANAAGAILMGETLRSAGICTTICEFGFFSLNDISIGASVFDLGDT